MFTENSIKFICNLHIQIRLSCTLWTVDSVQGSGVQTTSVFIGQKQILKIWLNMIRTWCLSSTQLHFSVSTPGGASHRKGASPLNKIKQRETFTTSTRNGSTKETQDSEWVQKISNTRENKYFFKEINGKCLFDLQWRCCRDEGAWCPSALWDQTSELHIVHRWRTSTEVGANSS